MNATGLVALRSDIHRQGVALLIGVAMVLLTGRVAWRYPRLRNYTADDAQALVVE